jgi:hypothetical protein
MGRPFSRYLLIYNKSQSHEANAMKQVLVVIAGTFLLSGAPVWAEDTSPYGAVILKDGYPLAADIDTIKSNHELSRASELFLWGMPMNASYAIRDGVLGASGGSHLDEVYSRNFIIADQIIPTLNNETYYAMVQIDLSKGPVVYQQPAADAKGYLFGSLSDVWQISVTDLGMPDAAPDGGKGGKYLFLPPGYSGDVPENYLVIKSTSNFTSMGMRSVMLGEGDKARSSGRQRGPMSLLAHWNLAEGCARVLKAANTHFRRPLPDY